MIYLGIFYSCRKKTAHLYAALHVQQGFREEEKILFTLKVSIIATKMMTTATKITAAAMRARKSLVINIS